MRKLKLLLATCALLGGAFSANAQTDVTSTYIDNPSFDLSAAGTDLTAKLGPNSSDALTIYGWTETLPDNGTMQNSGVYSSSDSSGSPFGTNITPADGKYYFFYRHGWNRNATTSDCTLKATSTLPAGKYMLSAKYQMSYNEDNATTKDTKIKLEAKDGSTVLGTATTGAATKNASFGNDKWQTLKCIFSLDAETSTDFVITMLAGGDKRSDFLIDDIRLYSFTDGDDLTSFINNAAVTSTTGWTNGRTGSGQQYTGAPDNTYLDTWNSTLDQKQTIQLPAGYYMLKAATRSSAYASGNIYAYVAEDDVTFRTDIHKEGSEGNLLGGGWAWTRVPVTLTQASAVTIGFWSNCNNSQWAGADNFTLTYYDSELNLAEAHFTQVREDAATWKTSLDASLTTGAKNALSTEDGKSYTSVAEYNEAIARLDAAITFARTTYTTLKAKYDAVKTLVKALPSQTEVYTGSATLSVNEEDVDAQVEAATTEADMNAAILVWRNAAATFLGAVTVNDNQFFNITNIFLDNADFSAGNILGWETNYVSGQQAQNIGYQGSSYTNGDVTISQFIEAWRPSGTLGDGYLRQTVQNLPEGKYTLEADAISVLQSNENFEVTGSFLYIYADGVDYKTTLNTLNNKPQHFSREFLNTGAGDVIFGLKTESSTGNWLCADNFTVKFYGVDLSAYETQLAEAVAEAEAVTGIPAGAASVLSDVVTANNKSYNTSSAYAAAISAIQTATATALTFQTPFANYNTAKETAKAFVQDDLTAGGWSALQTAISQNTVDLTSTSITVEALNTATENLNDACTAATTAQAAKVVYDNAVTTINGGTNVDLTSLLANPGFENNNIEGWTSDGSIAPGTQNNSSFGNKQGTYYCEKYHTEGTIDLNQTITALPAGIYKASAYVYSRTGDATFYANENSVDVTTSKLYSSIIEIADEGSIKLGVTCNSTNTTWICMDGFTLTYLGGIDDLEYTLATGKMGTDKSAAQAEAETTFNSEKTVANYNALLAAIADAEASVANYAKLKTAIDKATAVKNANNFVTAEAKTALEGEINTATTAWTNVTYTDAECTAEIALLGTTVSGWHDINHNGKAGAYIASAWGKTSENWWTAPYINTWSDEGDNDGSNFSVPFFEYYDDANKNLAANTFTATLTGMADGWYEVELWARVQRRSDADFNSDNNMITMSVNGGTAVSIMSNTSNNVGSGTSVMRLGRYTARGMVTNGTLTLSIDVKLGANVHWLSWRDVKYTKVSDLVTVTSAGMATYVSNVALDFSGKDVKAYTASLTGEEGNKTVLLTRVYQVPANTGLVLKGTADTYEIPVIASADAIEGNLMVGTLTVTDVAASTEGSYNYMLANTNGIGFYNVATATTSAAGKAYLHTTEALKKENGSSRVAMIFSDNDDATRLNNEIINKEIINNDVYNLNGQRVSKPAKGLYILKGKKVVIK